MTVARGAAEALGIPLLHNEETVKQHRKTKFDVLFVKHSVLRFCNYRELIFDLHANAGVVINIENDYTFDVDPRLHKCNKNHSMWTTVPRNITGQYGCYMNWNRAAWQHDAKLPNRLLGIENCDGLVYHGGLRSDRRSSFDRYFVKPAVTTVVRCRPKSKREFEQSYPDVICFVDDMNEMLELGYYRVGLYIEDDFSHEHFTSPAQRFYECLQIGLPMAVDSECLNTFKEADLTLRDEFLTSSSVDVKQFLKRRDKIQAAQRRLWYRDYKAELRSDVRAAARKHFGWKV